MVIGIDLASRKTGVAVIDNEGVLLKSTLIIMPRFSAKNLYQGTEEVLDTIMSLLVGFDVREATFVIELSNYSMKTAVMFSLMAGALVQALKSRKSLLVTPDEWQKEFMYRYQVRKVIKGSKARKGEEGFHKNETYYLCQGHKFKNIKEVIGFKYSQINGAPVYQDIMDAYFIALTSNNCHGWYKEKK